MARARKAVVDDDAVEAEAIKAYYRDRLTSPAQMPAFKWEPNRIGKSWQVDEDGYWLLPKHTLGWEMLAWTGMYLQNEDLQPLTWTDEQARFLLWWYAVDDTGRFLYMSGVLQRLKGWGKDPVGAGIGTFEMLGPCMFSHFDANGEVVGKPHPTPLVVVAAVSYEQTKNTMSLLPTYVTKRCVQKYGLQMGKTEATAYAASGIRTFKAVTSSPATLQGNRATFTLLNETHEWVSSNDGEAMHRVLRNNATKSKGGFARTLSITNAYFPGENSVGERERETYDKFVAGEAPDIGQYYDSIEAHPDAPLTPDAAPEIVKSVRGDSTWLDVQTIVKRLQDRSESVEQLRRFWYNQIVAAEDAWVTHQQVEKAFQNGKGLQLEEGDHVVLFGDGSKSDDASALVAVRVSDGLAELLHVDQPKKGELVSRPAYDKAVADAFEKFKVIGFWFDPSHAKDNYAAGEDDSYWRPLCDEWMVRYGQQLKLWAVNAGPQRHAILFDMAKPSNMEVFVKGAMQTAEDFEGGTVLLAGSKVLANHLNNARRLPSRWGVTVRKDGRESKRKIDAAVCLIGARAMWRKRQLSDVGTSKGTPGKGRGFVFGW